MILKNINIINNGHSARLPDKKNDELKHKTHPDALCGARKTQRKTCKKISYLK